MAALFLPTVPQCGKNNRLESHGTGSTSLQLAVDLGCHGAGRLLVWTDPRLAALPLFKVREIPDLSAQESADTTDTKGRKFLGQHRLRSERFIATNHCKNRYKRPTLAGAGIRGGTVYGESDPLAAYVRNKPVSPEDLGATILLALGIPSQTRLSPDGFTRPASTGEPVLELFSKGEKSW